MPLAMVKIGTKARVMSITGSDSIKHHLGSLGFVPGVMVKVMQLSYGNLILGIHDSRIAMDGALAHRILVEVAS